MLAFDLLSVALVVGVSECSLSSGEKGWLYTACTSRPELFLKWAPRPICWFVRLPLVEHFAIGCGSKEQIRPPNAFWILGTEGIVI